MVEHELPKLGVAGSIPVRRSGALPPPFFYADAVRFPPLGQPEQRVLGVLIEKRYATPDQYPLTLNGLRLACNQTTNRNPVTDYDEATVRTAAQRLCEIGLARLASTHSSRAIKYRHLAEEALGLQRPQLALLAVLLLRGPQTPGELKARSERLYQFPDLAAVDQELAALEQRGLVAQLERAPGQKEVRYVHLLGEPPAADAAPARQGDGIASRLADLEARLAALEERLAALEGGNDR